MKNEKIYVRLFLFAIVLAIVLIILFNIAKPVRYVLAVISFFIVFILSFVFIYKLISAQDTVLRDSKKSYDKYISFVIPVYNEGDDLRLCLDSIENIEYPKDKYEIIVVDDGSNNPITAQILEEYSKKYSNIKIIRKDNGGAASARNLGIINSNGEIIITIDSDSIIDKDAPAKLVSYFDDPQVAAVTGSVRVLNPDRPLTKWQSIEYDIILVYRRILEVFDSIYVTPGGLSAFRKEAIMKVGLFDTNSLTEDQEIALKLQKAGYKIMATLDAFAYTRVPDSLNKLVKQRVRWIRGGIWNRLKHRDLLNPKWGNLFIFGYVTDLIFFIPFITFFLTIFLFIIDNYIWFFRLGPEVMFLSIDHFLISTLVFWIILLPWQIFMINVLREKANEQKVKIKEIFDFIGFMIIFGWAWFLVWAFVIYKELTVQGNRWETR